MPHEMIKELLAKFYPEKQPDEADDPAMEAHLRLLLELAEDALDRQASAVQNKWSGGRVS